MAAVIASGGAEGGCKAQYVNLAGVWRRDPCLCVPAQPAYKSEPSVLSVRFLAPFAPICADFFASPKIFFFRDSVAQRGNFGAIKVFSLFF